ncbi:hypothetical protein [Arthrobacter castelli]|uniref:hypothetical protein n=1 Tax=Arthrobacter castelli TaxID=271431 RepID=UPI0003F5220C|nr:hypothetical protein [Arthrobacter castelli]
MANTQNHTEENQAHEIPPLIRHPKTYRLPLDAIELINLAVIDKRHQAERLTKEDAVAHAIRQTYGHLHQKPEK